MLHSNFPRVSRKIHVSQLCTVLSDLQLQFKEFTGILAPPTQLQRVSKLLCFPLPFAALSPDRASVPSNSLLGTHGFTYPKPNPWLQLLISVPPTATALQHLPLLPDHSAYRTKERVKHTKMCLVICILCLFVCFFLHKSNFSWHERLDQFCSKTAPPLCWEKQRVL